MDGLSDTELMALVKEGDYGAFDVLYHRYRGPVLRFLFALTWDAQAAEDGLQEVFVGLFRARADYVPTAKLSTYLFQIARNHYLSQRSGGLPLLPRQRRPRSVCGHSRQ